MSVTKDQQSHFFSTVDDAIAHVLPHCKEWMLLSSIQKSRLISECISNLKKYHTTFEEAGLRRRNYHLLTEDTQDKKKVIIAETEKALIQMLTSTHLAYWLSILKYTFDTIGKTGKFPKPQHIARNSDGTLRLTISPPDYFTWSVSGFSILELHVEDPNSPQVEHTKELSPQKSSIIEAVSGIPLEPEENGVKKMDNKENGKCETEQEKDQQNKNEHFPSLAELQHDPSEMFAMRGGEVAAVLGAGNFDCPVDFLTAMFIENNVVVYKFSPLAELLAAPFTAIFQPLISKGYLSFTSGGAEEGSKLLHHPDVKKWFMTGDSRTANQILFGTPESPFKDRKPGSVTYDEMQEKMKIKKPFTIELGNCSPYIIAPGKWSDAELYHHARHLTLGLLMNGGHICAHPQVIVTCKNWPQREQFLQHLRQAISESKVAGAFYPTGTAKLEKYKEKLEFEGVDMEAATLNDGTVVLVNTAKPTSALLKEEAFCCIAGEFPLDTPPTMCEFLPAAVDLVNAEAHGSLCATIIAKTQTKDEQESLNDAVSKLSYGSIGINIYGLIAIYFPQLVWGGHPRNVDAAHPQSGIGFFGNSYGFRHPIKSVIRSPFLGPNQFVQVIPRGREVSRFQKMLSRVTTGLCNQSTSSYSTGFVDWFKIGCAAMLNW